MKKQLLIVFTGPMELGGIERSLLGLLDSIDYDKYDVDLFLYAHHGPLFHLINKNANILPEVKELAYIRESLKEKLNHKCYYSAFLRFVDEIKSKFGYVINNDHTWCKVMRKYAPKLDKEYDAAISFFLPFDFIKENVRAKKKIGWIHTDYATLYGINGGGLKKSYEGLDVIAAVSECCKDTFAEVVPTLKDKVVIIENILSTVFIKQQSEIDVDDFKNSKDEISLLSIGRFTHQKNFDNVPEICSLIRKNGLNVKWYLIGYGTDEPLIKNKIKEFGMEDYVIIIGKKDNPYSYIKQCDVYVQPSRYEGNCVCVHEAQILNKPVVITDYATSASQLKDGFDGVIVPMDNIGCAEGITNLLKNNELLNRLSENTKSVDYSNSSEIEKIYSLIE